MMGQKAAREYTNIMLGNKCEVIAMELYRKIDVLYIEINLKIEYKIWKGSLIKKGRII